MIDDFMEIFAPEIEFEIMQKYNQVVPYSVNATQRFHFPNGGMVHYETESGNEIVATYYDKKDTEKYIQGRQKVTVRDVLLEILGEIPEYGKYFDALSLILTVIDLSVEADIDNAGGYARITSIYDPDSGMVSAAFGWTTYPMSMAYSASSEILNCEFFPAK